MSVILDALKKLEREKASHRSGPVDIVPEITISSKQRQRFGKWKISAMITGAVIATAVATTLVVTSFISRDRKAPPVAAASTQTVHEAPPLPPVPKPPAAASPGNSPAPLSESAPQPSSEPARPLPHETKSPKEQAISSPVSAEKNEETVQSDAGAPASLVVSGIAWQDDRAARRAVVNGALVGEGAEIGGVRIVRIYRDKVRFSIDGRTFDVSMTGQPQGKQSN
jgi:general secretion pathway protein B